MRRNLLITWLLTAAAIVAGPVLCADAPGPGDGGPIQDANRAAAIAAGDYLIRVQQEDGRFLYFYNPAAPEVREPYNWLRHAGTGYALAQLHEVTGEARFRAGARRAADFLVQSIEPATIGERTTQVVMSDLLPGSGSDRGKLIKTGGCALGVLAFWAADVGRETPLHRERMRALGEYLLDVQRPDGGFKSIYLVQRKKFDTTESEYYPGQALLALALIEREMPDKRIRSAMLRALAERVGVWTGPRTSAFDHWGLIGASRVLPIVSDGELAEFVGMSRHEILSTIVRYAGSELPRQLDDGSFSIARGSAPAAATRIEGLHAVGRLLRRPGPAEGSADDDLVTAASAWLPAIRRTQRFLLGCPFSAEQVARFSSGPVDIRGGLREQCRPGKLGALRIDNSQHGISALIGELSPF